MDDMKRVVSYWSGPIPEISRLHFESFKHFGKDWGYSLYLDTDLGPAPSDEILASIVELGVDVVHFSLQGWLIRSGLPKIYDDSSQPVWHLLHRLERKLLSWFHEATHGYFSSASGRFEGPRNGWHQKFGYSPGHSLGSSFLGSDLPGRSDLFRCLVATQFPESDICYSDLDICFTRNLSEILSEVPISYKWDDFANSAFLYLPRKAKKIRRIIFQGIKSGLSAKPWVMFSEYRCVEMDLLLHPVELFDPVWSSTSVGREDPMLFFRNHKNSEAFFEEVLAKNFAVHWHNNWNTTAEEGSTYSLLSDFFKSSELKNQVKQGT